MKKNRIPLNDILTYKYLFDKHIIISKAKETTAIKDMIIINAKDVKKTREEIVDQLTQLGLPKWKANKIFYLVIKPQRERLKDFLKPV